MPRRWGAGVRYSTAAAIASKFASTNAGLTHTRMAPRKSSSVSGSFPVATALARSTVFKAFLLPTYSRTASPSTMIKRSGASPNDCNRRAIMVLP